MNRRPSIRSLLRSHVPSDERESGFVEAMLALLEVGGDPLSRDLFTPGHFTASAFVISPDESSLMLVFHGKLHRWLQPGGHIEPEDADLFAAVKREVAEEVGITEVDVVGGLFDVDIHDIPARKGEPGHRHYDLRVLLRSRTTSFVAGSDARAARWVPLGEVDPAESDESVMRAVRKITTG